MQKKSEKHYFYYSPKFPYLEIKKDIKATSNHESVLVPVINAWRAEPKRHAILSLKICL